MAKIYLILCRDVFSTCTSVDSLIHCSSVLNLWRQTQIGAYRRSTYWACWSKKSEGWKKTKPKALGVWGSKFLPKSTPNRILLSFLSLLQLLWWLSLRPSSMGIAESRNAGGAWRLRCRQFVWISYVSPTILGSICQYGSMTSYVFKRFKCGENPATNGMDGQFFIYFPPFFGDLWGQQPCLLNLVYTRLLSLRRSACKKHLSGTTTSRKTDFRLFYKPCSFNQRNIMKYP